MAKCLSFVHTTIRGSIGGRTYTSSPYAEIMARTRVIPNNPSTIYQQMIRNGIRSGNVRWELLSDEERNAWDQYASTCLYPSPIKPYHVPGRLIAIGNFATVNYHNELPLDPFIVNSMDKAPVIAGRLALADVIIRPLIAAGTGFNIQFTNYNGEAVYAYASRSMALSPARNRYSGPFIPQTTLRVEVADEVSSIGLDFTGLVEDFVYFVKLGVYSVGSGDGERRSGEPLTLRAIAVVTPP